DDAVPAPEVPDLTRDPCESQPTHLIPDVNREPMKNDVAKSATSPDDCFANPIAMAAITRVSRPDCNTGVEANRDQFIAAEGTHHCHEGSGLLSWPTVKCPRCWSGSPCPSSSELS